VALFRRTVLDVSGREQIEEAALIMARAVGVLLEALDLGIDDLEAPAWEDRERAWQDFLREHPELSD
jgi:hypothetical protein